MTLEELDRTLPNGFHDAEFKTIAIDYGRRTLTIEVTMSVSDPDKASAEDSRDGTLVIEGVQFVVIEPPDAREHFAKNKRLWVDLSKEPDASEVPAVSAVPADCFVAGFFVRNWNSKIYGAGRSARLTWTSNPYQREHAYGW